MARAWRRGGAGACMATVALLLAAASGDALEPTPAGEPTPASVCPAAPSLESAAPSPTPPGLPSSPGPYRPAPTEIVACVGMQAITGTTFAQWAKVASKVAGAAHPQPSVEPNRKEMQQVMGFLITSDWMI